MVEVEPLAQFIQERVSENGLSLADALSAAKDFKLSLAEVEVEVLKNNKMPMRYIRNNLTCNQQLGLFQSRVSVIGCGGLGGTVAALLARIGIGHVHLVDPDVFEEHNLNRQRFCTTKTIGLPKAEVAASILPDINPSINCTHRVDKFSKNDIAVSEIIVDCLDSINDRRHLADLCQKHERPLVHGAVKEWYGQVGISSSNNNLFNTLYSQVPQESSPSLTKNKQAPKVLAPTVSYIASIQVIEVCKLVLKLPSELHQNWLSCDLLASTLDQVPSY